LQADAYRAYGLTPEVTLSALQHLYEDSLVSYPRSACEYLSSHEPFEKLVSFSAKILEEDTKTKVNCYDRVESLIKDSDKKSIIVLDKNMYENFKEEDLKEFHVLYTGSEDLSYGFLLRDVNENKTFSSLFTTYIELLNYKQLNNSAWKDYLVDSKEISYTYLYIMGAVVVLAILFGFLRKNSKITKNIKNFINYS